MVDEDNCTMGKNWKDEEGSPPSESSYSHLEDLFSPSTLLTSRQSSESSASLNSDSDIDIQSDGETEFALPSPVICPDVETEVDSPTGISEEPAQIESDKEPMITTDMPLSEILEHLGSHGCNDVTLDLDKSKCSQYALSHGGFGDVFRGALRDGTRVGIKCLKLQLSSSDEREKHLKHAARELYVWSKCEHPNVLPLIGMARFESKIAMVSPWMENGTLTSFVSRHPEVDRYEMCAQIAQGVYYLHHSGIIHGDIKGSNILVSRDFTPKLADFGNAWLGDTVQSLRFSDTTSVPSMSIRWAAPEVFQGTVKSSAEADVYALGMTILETISGCVPYREFTDLAVIPRILDGKHPERSELQGPLVVARGDRLWSVLTRCWDRDPRNRPTSKEVRDEMRALVGERST